MENKASIAGMLYLRFSVIWGQKFTANHGDEKIIEIWIAEWHEGLSGISVNQIKDAVDYCKVNLVWPPSLAEFIDYCYRNINIPSSDDCLRMAVNRDFTHPIVKKIYDQVGSWEMQNGKSVDLKKRFEELHDEYVTELRMSIINTSQVVNITKPTLVHDSTQGSVTDERKQISRSSTGGAGLRKAQDYLF